MKTRRSLKKDFTARVKPFLPRGWRVLEVNIRVREVRLLSVDFAIGRGLEMRKLSVTWPDGVVTSQLKKDLAEFAGLVDRC